MTAFCRVAQEDGDFGGDGSFTDQRLLRSMTEPDRSPCNLSLFPPLSYRTKLSPSCQVHFLHSSFLPFPHVPPSSGERSPHPAALPPCTEGDCEQLAGVSSHSPALFASDSMIFSCSPYTWSFHSLPTPNEVLNLSKAPAPAPALPSVLSVLSSDFASQHRIPSYEPPGSLLQVALKAEALFQRLIIS